MSSHQHTKTLSTDSRSKNRIRYASTKDRAKKASADVYRSYKRRVGVAQTTAAAREERVHHPGGGPKSSSKKKRKKTFVGEGGEKKTTIVVGSKERGDATADFELIERAGEEVDDELLPQDVESCFASELDLAQDRNASELFGKMYRDIWPLTRSLAEMLHHADDIVAVLLCYLLSPESDPGAPTERKDIAHMLQKEGGGGGTLPVASGTKRIPYVVNLVTTDVLHLIGVLARDFRHEIHAFVHPAIVPRIVYDLLNPPPPPPSETDKRQQIPLDVTVVEAAFRALSYVFRYDSDLLIKGEKVGDGSSGGGSNNMEPMRQYYGATLAHRRDYVRRLAAETYAPLIRRMRSDSARSKHIRRVIRALAASAAAGSGGSGDGAIRTVQRARMDAIDGVALLLSQTSCGVPGRLHSKAQSTVSSTLGCLTPETESADSDVGQKAKKKNKDRLSIGKKSKKLYSIEEANKREVVFAVSSSYLSMLRGHIDEGQNFVLVWYELRQALDSSINSLVQVLSGDDKRPREVMNDCLDGIHYMLQLIDQCVNYRNGCLLEDNDEADDLSGVLEKLFEERIYKQLDRKSQSSSLSLLCSLWKAKPDHSLFATKFGRFFPSLVKITGSDNSNSSIDPALVLAKELLPYLPWGVAKRSLVPALLAAASQRSPEDSSLILLHAVATANLSPLMADSDRLIVESEDKADEDALFWLHHANDCSISASRLDALVDTCLGDPDTMLKNQVGISRVAFAARCLPFLSNLGAYGDEGNTDEAFDRSRATAIKRIFSWSLSVLKTLGAKRDEDRRSSKGGKSRSSSQTADSEGLLSGAIVAQSLILESLSIIASSCIENDFEEATATKALLKAREYANNLMFASPRSVWSMRAAAAMVGALEKIKEMLNDSSNETFDLLSPNLKAQGHFLRLHTLVILNSYPRRPYVVDHSELDHTDDLDEEGDSFQPPVDSQQTTLGKSAVSGPCDIIETLLKIEAMPVTLANERKLNGEINRVEVLCRTGRVPIVYAEAVSNHMLGLFHVKFAPVWPAAVRALAAVAVAQETSAWPTLAQKLDEVMKPEISSNEDTEEDEDKDETDETKKEGKDDPISQIRHHQNMCVAWDKSNGADVRLFGDGHDIDGGGRVSRHRTTDSSIIFENTWKVMESVPQLTVRKSKVIVPIFLEFLHFQYYRFHDDDPDARELSLEGHLGDDSKEKGSSWSRHDLSRRSLQKKLTSFLKMFAAINGPQQLYKHKLLFNYFLVTLSNPDEGTAQLALKCFLKFKPDYAIPYAEYLSSLLKKKEFRDTLTKFDLSKKEGSVDSQHRHELIPVIVRILFGRFSSRGAGAKSSKDSPAARRAAILSFLTSLGKNEGELDYFVYMMVRVFIPPSVNMSFSVGNNTSPRVERLIESATSIQADELEEIHCQRVEGFLNLLSDVISQLGFGVKAYVPVFMSLLQTICERTEGMRKVSTAGIDAVGGDDSESSNSDGSDYDSTNINAMAWQQRVSAIRSLCLRRISDLVLKFASSYDFLPYANRLWTSLDQAIQKLPGTVVNAEKPPSLLYLLESFSSHSSLIRLLYQTDDAMAAVFKCISKSSRHQVVTVALSFIENLLTEGGTIEEGVLPSSVEGAVGWKLVQRHVHLLVRQFTERLESGTPESLQKADARKETNVAQRELDILCRVSELLVAEQTEDEDVSVLENLSSLLIPFLNFERRADEYNQRNVLGILERIIPRIRHGAAMSHLQSLAKLLGPNKGNPGISSLEIRQMVVACIGAISRHEEDKDDESIVLRNVCASLNMLVASHHKHIEECNFDAVLPVLNGLGGPPEQDGGWISYTTCEDEVATSSTSTVEEAQTKKLTPLIYCCFHMLFDEDGVLSRGASKALKTLVSAAASQGTNEWLQLIETTFISCVRMGLTSHHPNARRLFVLLISEVARSFSSSDNTNLYGDLSVLIRDDDPDLDFFLNVTHVQVHRRGRAFDRLRKLLARSEKCPFSSHSLSNVLLPLAIHPIYECSNKAEETYALEGIATVGAVAKHLPWGKYHNTLWTALTQLSRKPDQERFITAMICALMDAFHFDVVLDRASASKFDGDEDITGDGNEGVTNDKSQNDEDDTQKEGNSVWRALKNRLIPKIESYLMKEKVDSRSGSVTKTLRSPIALALVKLYQKLPRQIFEARLPRLLTITCGGLKSRDSTARGVARDTLAKIAATIDVKYLSEVIRELAIALSEGYQLHVRSAALYSVILSVTKAYERPESPSVDEARKLPFDNCVPAIMDLIQQDIFGSASEIKEADNVQKRLVKEAGGAKSHETLELMAKYILFRPSLAAEAGTDNLGEVEQRGNASPSSVHAIVSPLLERLRDPEVSTSTIGKAKECLNRVTLGLSRNSSVEAEEVLTFVYASVSPFVLGDAMRTKGNFEDDSGDSSGDDDDEDDAKPLKISRTKKGKKQGSVSSGRKKEDRSSLTNVVKWHPSSAKAAANEKMALEEKKREKLQLRKVIDGASAPKMTGSSRYDAVVSTSHSSVNDQAGASAVHFGLGLLHACMKKSKFNIHDETTLMMADPYVPMLTRCVRDCKDNKVILLSLKCLGFLLKMDLPSVKRNAEMLSTFVLKILTESGSVGDTKNEIIQNCFRSLTLLLSLSNKDEQFKDPLNEQQMQALVGLLLAALSESEQNTATFNLIKSIISRRHVSSEFYDMMEVILKLSVQSQNSSVRQQCCQIFMQFLIEYPMGKQRLEDHLKQMILNIKYEYEEGRLSAIGLVGALINKLPTPMIEEHAQLFFLPLVLQLVNDDSKKCREAVAESIGNLLKRLSFDTAQALYEYVVRWSSGSGVDALPLRRTSSQVFGIFVESRPDFLKRGNLADDLVDSLHASLISSDDNGTSTIEWELHYFTLICLEKIQNHFPSTMTTNNDLWMCIVKALIHPHAWVKQASSRILNNHMVNLKPQALVRPKKGSPKSFLVAVPGSLFEIARNLCFQLNAEDKEQVDAVNLLAIKSLTWIISTMSSYPTLCFKDSGYDSVDSDESVDDDRTNDDSEVRKDPVRWLMMRLSNIAKARGSRRREAIFKCFAAFASSCDPAIITPHLELMIEPLNRTLVEISSKAEQSQRRRAYNGGDEAELPKEVMQLLEDQCGTEPFLNALAAVKSKAREKREKRKQEAAAEAVHDPAAAAQRKIRKQAHEKKRRKRRVEENRAMRGGYAKKNRVHY